MINMRRKKQNGFTIVELLVATMVFSVVLLVVTAGILQVARLYYRGFTEAATQNTARSIMDTLAQTIQFSGGTLTSASNAFCIANQRFSYQLGVQSEDSPDTAKHQSYHALVQDTASGCVAQSLTQPAITGRDLIAPHMRLSDLTITSTAANQYRITVRVVYGDDDLLNNPTTTTASCKNIRVGTQFCAVSELSTVVIKRVQ